MTVSRLSGNRVLIYLENGDMREYALDFDSMDPGDSRSMKVISSLSRAACRDNGIPTGGRRLRVEALGMDDGCWLLVTVGSKQKTYRRKAGGLCYRFGNVSDFTECVSQLNRAGIACAKSRAYERGGEYYLAFGYSAIPKRARVILSEYSAQKCQALTAARLGEYGKMLCPKNAVSVIGGAF